MVLRKHSRIDLSLPQHLKETAEERQWRLQDLSLLCHSSSYLTAPEERQGRLQDPSVPAVSVNSWRLLKRGMGDRNLSCRPRHLAGCVIKDQSDAYSLSSSVFLMECIVQMDVCTTK